MDVVVGDPARGDLTAARNETILLKRGSQEVTRVIFFVRGNINRVFNITGNERKHFTCYDKHCCQT